MFAFGRRCLATLVAAALVGSGALVATPASAAGAWKSEYYVAESGKTVKCLYVATHKTKNKREVMYYDRQHPKRRLVWEGAKGTGWQDGWKLKTVWVDDGFGGYPVSRKDRRMQLKLRGTDPRRVAYRTQGGTTKKSPKMAKVTWRKYIKSSCPTESY